MVSLRPAGVNPRELQRVRSGKQGAFLDRRVFIASIVRLRCGRVASMYLALFFLAVAAAPHRHLNDLQDLLLDQRSDSGILVEPIGPASTSEALAFRAIRLVPDIPCPACFTRDFICAPTAMFLFVGELGPLPLLPSLPDVATPALVLAEAASRAPPQGS